MDLVRYNVLNLYCNGIVNEICVLWWNIEGMGEFWFIFVDVVNLGNVIFCSKLRIK